MVRGWGGDIRGVRGVGLRGCRRGGFVCVRGVGLRGCTGGGFVLCKVPSALVAFRIDFCLVTFVELLQDVKI